MLLPLLCLLEGAEGSQVVVYPRQGGAVCLQPSACSHLPAIPTPKVIADFILASPFKDSSWCEGTRGMEGTFPPVVLKTTHFESSSWCEGSGQTSPMPHCLFQRALSHPERHRDGRNTPYLQRVPSPRSLSIHVGCSSRRWCSAPCVNSAHPRHKTTPGRAPSEQAPYLREQAPYLGSAISRLHSSAACLCKGRGPCKGMPTASLTSPWGQQLPEER